MVRCAGTVVAVRFDCVEASLLLPQVNPPSLESLAVKADLAIPPPQTPSDLVAIH